MLPTPKDCTACGSTDNDPDNPLMVYSCTPSGIAVGWVHKNCRDWLAFANAEMGMQPEWFEVKWPKTPKFHRFFRSACAIAARRRPMLPDQVSLCHTSLCLQRFRVTDRIG